MPARRKRAQAVIAARWLYLGRQIDGDDGAGKLSGVDPKTVRRWMRRADWPEIQEEARIGWLEDLAAAARDGLTAAVRTDGRLALQTLERLDDRLAPAPQTVELRALLSRLDPATLPDEVVAQLASGKNVLGVLLSMLGEAGNLSPLAPALPRLNSGEIIVDPDELPEGDA